MTNGNYEKLVEQITDLVLAKIGNDAYCPSFCRADVERIVDAGASRIGIVLGGPYNSGILATGPKTGAFYNYDPAPKPILERVAKIEAICKKHKVKLPEAALRFPLLHPCVVSVIPGAVSPKEVALNVKTLSAKIPKALWKELKISGLMDERANT